MNPKQLFFQDFQEPSAPWSFYCLVRIFRRPCQSVWEVNLIQWYPKEKIRMWVSTVILIWSGNDWPFTLEPPFVPNEHQEKHRNTNIRSDKWLIVERRLEYCETLNQEQENIEKEVAPVDRNMTRRFKGEFFGVNTLLLCGSADPKLGKCDSSPCDIGCCAAERGEIGKEASSCCLQGHQTQEAPHIWEDDCRVWDCTRYQLLSEGG